MPNTLCARSIDKLFFLYYFVGQKSSSTPEKKDFECPSGYGNGNFADPANCRRFYQVNQTIRFIERKKNILHSIQRTKIMKYVKAK